MLTLLRMRQSRCGFLVECRTLRYWALIFACVAVTAGLITVVPARAFPPYKSTDADTADPRALELRVGTQAARSGGDTEVLAPRVRANFGLPNKIELVSEFDFAPRSGKFDDAAAGVKWIPFFSNTLGIGAEALLLLPVRPADHGVGTETQLVVTFKTERALLHVNAGGLYDPRGPITTSGWRASGLAEVPADKYRVGFEVFAKDTNLHSVDVRIGAGIIYNLGVFDIRLGAHAGLTRGAPDATVNFWIGRAFSFR